MTLTNNTCQKRSIMWLMYSLELISLWISSPRIFIRLLAKKYQRRKKLLETTCKECFCLIFSPQFPSTWLQVGLSKALTVFKSFPCWRQFVSSGYPSWLHSWMQLMKSSSTYNYSKQFSWFSYTFTSTLVFGTHIVRLAPGKTGYPDKILKKASLTFLEIMKCHSGFAWVFTLQSWLYAVTISTLYRILCSS